MDNIKLVEREIEGRHNHHIWFDAILEDGRKYSVVNQRELMKTAPYYTDEQKEDWFGFWEAIEIIDGKLDLENEPIKAKTWEEVEKLLASNPK